MEMVNKGENANANVKHSGYITNITLLPGFNNWDGKSTGKRLRKSILSKKNTYSISIRWDMRDMRDER